MPTRETVQELINQNGPDANLAGLAMRQMLTDLLSLIPEVAIIDITKIGYAELVSEGQVKPSLYRITDASGGAIVMPGRDMSEIWAAQEGSSNVFGKYNPGTDTFTPASGSSSTRRQVFTPTAGQTVFTLTYSITSFKPIVTLNGVEQRQGLDYNTGEDGLTWLDYEGITLDDQDKLTIYY